MRLNSLENPLPNWPSWHLALIIVLSLFIDPWLKKQNKDGNYKTYISPLPRARSLHTFLMDYGFLFQSPGLQILLNMAFQEDTTNPVNLLDEMLHIYHSWSKGVCALFKEVISQLSMTVWYANPKISGLKIQYMTSWFYRSALELSSAGPFWLRLATVLK